MPYYTIYALTVLTLAGAWHDLDPILGAGMAGIILLEIWRA